MSFYSNLPSGHNDTSSVSSLYPTIFEIISSQEIDALLPTSVRYLIVNYWISRHPSKLSLQINNYFHEWFDLLLKGAIECYHINRYNSTFVDKFYGLQRFNASNKVLVQAQANSSVRYWPNGLTLSGKQKAVVLFEKVLLPYIRQKLDDLHAKYVARSAFSSNGNQSVVVKKLYPLIKKLFYVLNLFVKLFFLGGRIGSITFLEYLFQIEYTRMTLPLESSITTKSNPPYSNRLPRQNLYSLWHKCYIVLRKMNQILSYSGSQLFPAFIFMLRVYQWWTTQDLTAKLQRKLNDVDKFIPRANNSSDQAYKSTGICPICHNQIQNPGVLETGYAACYPCAIAYLPKNEGRCPVTKKRLLGCKYNAELGKWQVISGVRKLLVT
ncbi:hypothetical protein HG536_0G01120 [Torulaspora globosa]|uniref:Peroxisome assembly protein 12 n=1 Tax=Torulaspora globosa TaxID=48254 RepID=A0A7G3ZL67_9SACH|nr:uncharacterized protein HG536_0G01120 [Torulaspora globosa]QLL34253.1 hypothetical protein HG536_0G01120 [Torulaspora globosa]